MANSNGGLQGETIPAMFFNAVASRGGGVALREKDLGIWKSQSWSELGQVAREAGLGLVALGLAPGECASIVANTVKEWLHADYGILGAGGVSNGIYPTDAPTQVAYLLEDSQSIVVFVENDEQLDKVLEVRDRLPKLRNIIVFDMEGLQSLDDGQVMSMADLCVLGRAYGERHPAAWGERLESRKPQDLAILIYTSGTTGRPKGAMISHANVVHTVRGYQEIVGQNERDERMCFLPMCHVAERVGGAYFALYTGTVLNFVENPETVPENIREISPTVVAAVPRVWEKFYSSVTISVAESSPLQRWVYARALAIGERVAALRIAARPLPVALAAAYALARWVALNNVRRAIGIHRARFLVTGAAPISPDLVRWYLALGVPMLEVWGQTESCGAATATPLTLIKPGRIGPACPYNEVRVSPEGELLIRGGNVFMGYLHQPDKTAEAIDAEGWLHTGDVGDIDADGYFRIHDRIKDIIITAGGKNITPSEFENELKFSPYVTDAVVIGDRRPFLTVLVMIDQENVEKYAQDHDVPFSNYASLTRAQAVQDLIWSEIERVNRRFARVEQVKKFRLIEQRLSAEDEELTPTMKLKRRLVQQKYSTMIEAMYHV